MSFVARNDQSILGQWWWRVDKWTLASFYVLIVIGYFLILAASPPIAERLGFDAFYFTRKQSVYFILSILMIPTLSMFTPVFIRRLSFIGFIFTLVLIVLTLLIGTEMKGATRWLSIAGLSIQPSEFVKPLLAVVSAWLLTRHRQNPNFPGLWMSIGCYVITVILLMSQPDLGMTIVVTAIWGTQLILWGLPIIYIPLMGITSIVGLVGAYFSLAHVRSRVDRFIHPESGDTYQIEKSLEAFKNGGFFGRGPGEGRVKEVLPDAYTDFIFSVAGEEFGIFICLAIVVLFTFVIFRGFRSLLRKDDFFTLLAGSGLLMQVAVQSFVNMASALHMVPTKGMTLPFISYGGSSLVAMAMGMGILLCLLKKN